MKAILITLAAIATLPAWAADAVVPYPEGYRAWAHGDQSNGASRHPSLVTLNQTAQEDCLIAA